MVPVFIAFVHNIFLFFMFSYLYDPYVGSSLLENKLQAAESKLSKFVEDIIKVQLGAGRNLGADPQPSA